MENWLGVLRRVLTHPQLYPGYVMPEEKLTWEPVKLGLDVVWILSFICIAVVVLAYFLFARVHGRKAKIEH